MNDAAHSRPLLDDGAMVDHFKVAHLLGRGGMGEVYLARDMQLGRKVALKIVRPEMIGDDQAVERFLFEARVTARFSHPHIVTIYAVGSHAGNPYVALEYLEGQSLRERISAGPVGPLEAARIAMNVAEALTEAHGHGVLHRDLKPENVHLPRDGRLRVLDFGLAKTVAADGSVPLETVRAATLVAKSLVKFETQGSAVMGTPQYMAPEQWTESRCTGATDVWALGVMLFEMLEGKRPFAGTTVFAMCAAVCSEESAPRVIAAGVSADLAAITARCLAKRPEERPTAAQVAEDLAEVVSRGRGRAKVEESPFRGLLPFTEQHAASFFGRDEEVAAFVERLRDEPIVAVVGPSGAGKSSFVQAGAVPRLREQGKWVVLSLRPGSSPFEALAARLVRGDSAETRTSTPNRLSSDAGGEAALAAELREAPGRLALVLGDLAVRENARVLLHVDQLEELYALVPDEGVRLKFMEALCAAADDPGGPVRVVLALRDDFLGKVAMGETARRALSRVTALRSPGPVALREIAARPLADAGYSYEDPALSAEMAAAVQGEPASLPLLQFALTALWETRDREKKIIPKAAYASLGGVEGALARHADGVLAALSPEDVRSAREIFLRLVTPEGTRRAVAREELLAGLSSGATGVVDLLVRERAIVSRKGKGEGGSELELVHESLIRKWERLARWIDEGREELVFLAEARQAAVAWEKKGRPADGLWQGDALRDGERQAVRLPSLPNDVRRFLAAGRALSSRRAKRKRIALTLGFVFLAVVAVVLFFMNREAVRQRWAAEARRTEARQRQAEALVTGASAAIERKDPLSARAMLRAALELGDRQGARTLWARTADDQLEWSLDLGTPVWGAAVFPDGKTVAVGGTDGGVYLVELASRTIRVLRGHKASVRGVAVSQDGRRIASGDATGSIRIWDTGSGRLIHSISGSEKAILGLAFSLVENDLYWRTEAEMGLWKQASGERDAIPLGRESLMRSSVAISPDGSRIAVGEEQNIALIDAASRRVEKRLPLKNGPPRALAFDLDGSRLAAATFKDETVRIWRVGTWNLEKELNSVQVYYMALAFAPDRENLAIGTFDGSILFWNLDNGKVENRFQPGTSVVSGLAFSPKGERLVASYSYGRQMNLWKAASRDDNATVERQPMESFVGLSISRDGARIATGTDTGDVFLFDVASGKRRELISGDGNTVYATAFSPDSSRIAIGDDAGRIQVIDPNSRALIQQFGLPRFVLALAYHPSRPLLAASGAAGYGRVWDDESGRLEQVLMLDPSEHWSISFSADGAALVTAGQAGTIRVFDTKSWTETLRLEAPEPLRGVVFCGENQTLVSGGKDGSIRRWNPETGANALVSSVVGVVADPVCHPDGGRVGVTGAMSTAEIIEIVTGKVVNLVGHSRNEDVNRIRFSPDGKLAVTSCDDGTIRTWYVDDGQPFWRAPLFVEKTAIVFTHEGWIDLRAKEAKPRPSAKAWETTVESRAREAEAPKDATHLCIRTHDAKVAIWDMATDKQLAEVPLEGLARVAAFPEGCLALTGDRAVIVDLAGKIKQLTENATAISWDEDAILVAAAREARLFSKDGKQLRAWKTDVGPTALKRVGKWLAVGYGDGAVELQPIDGKAQVPALEDRIPTPVTIIAAGPAGTLLVGHENGGLGLWSLVDGARLDARYVHGPVRHLLFDGNLVRAVSELGDRMELDLSVYTRPYCDLLREVWKEVPVVWEGGKPVRRDPPKDHPCAAR